MIEFNIRNDEDNSILFRKILKSLDEIPSVLIGYLRSINCDTEVIITPEDKDFYYWVEKSSDSYELFSD